MPVIFPRYNIAEVHDYPALFVPGTDGARVLNEATALLINYLPVIGVPELTKRNVEDAWLRIAAHQAQLGTPIDGTNGQRWYLTRVDVLRHIGLKTEGTEEPIERFWQYLSNRRPDSELDSPFVRANNGQCLLSLVGVEAREPPGAEA
jgi:hypothetical protein